MNNYFLARKSMNFNDGDVGSFTLWWTEFESLVFLRSDSNMQIRVQCLSLNQLACGWHVQKKKEKQREISENVINYAWKLQTMLRCV